MADDHTLRSQRSNDPCRRAAEPTRPSQHASGNDPLAELARLIGENDPYAAFGRTSSRQEQQRESYGSSSSGHDDWHYPSAAEQRPFSEPSRARASYRPDEDLQLSREPRVDERRSGWEPYQQVQLGSDSQGEPYPDDGMDDEQENDHGAVHHYGDDASLAPTEEQIYDDAPRARHRGGLATALALIGCAMLGTAGAYAYRSYYGHAASTQPPPVITADSSTPAKIVPAPAGDPQSGKVIQDRVANAGQEQLVTKQEEPVALKDLGTQAAPRVVLPAPVAPVQGGSAAQQPTGSGSGTNEPKKVRTVTIRPDGADVNGRPGAAPSAQSAQVSPSAAKPSQGRSSGGPLSLDPQAKEPAAAPPPARTRTATLPPSTGSRPEPSFSGGYVVQLSSQKSEAEAYSSYRSLQAKFPNELGRVQPIIRRADLGSKGVFYRTLVGPFASANEATQFCANYKAAGGHCVVPNN